MNVAILQGQEQLTRQLLRSLQSYQIKGDLVNKINNKLLITHDFLIVSSEQQPKIPIRVLEQIVLQKQIVLIYVHHQSNLGSLYNLLDDPYFLTIEKTNVVEILPTVLLNVYKWQKEVSILQKECQTSKSLLNDTKNTIHAKRILMQKGMSEDDAHNWIQKASMDRRCKKSDIVNLIIKEKIDID